jgi:hypothetical protein
MSDRPAALPGPAGYLVVRVDVAERLAGSEAREVERMFRVGASVDAQRHYELAAVWRALASSEPSPVAEVAQRSPGGPPPTHWLSARTASEVAGVSRQALSKRLRSRPPTLIGVKWRGGLYYDPDVLAEVFGK